MEKLIEGLKQKITIKKAKYLMFSMGIVYYEIPQKENLLLNIGYKEIIKPALEEIGTSIQEKALANEELSKYLWDREPHLAFLLEETEKPIELIILSFLHKELSIQEIFTVPLESLPDTADPKYGIVLLDEKISANHQGIFYKDKFYYYSPLYGTKRNAKTPPQLVQLLTEQMVNNNYVSLRLDQTLSISIEHYKPFMREFAEVYQGREINLDKIQFPFHPGKSEYFCVYNPETMKRIQFKISHRKDSERWIEIEELWSIGREEEQEVYMTKYLHSIFNPLENKFVHIDGSFNFYNLDNYKIRKNQQINAHADLHIKQWLVEGEINIIDWGKMVLHFYNDPDLILDAFEGNLIEEVFEENYHS